MDQFAHLVVGYHGCTEDFARPLLFGDFPVQDWRPSTNDWDWLGDGIYFWEHSPERALRWAREKYRKRRDKPTVLGAVLQLGRCFDLLNEALTNLLAETYQTLVESFARKGDSLPQNRGAGLKRRALDRLVINYRLDELKEGGVEYDTVRGAFLEGEPVYPGAGFSRESHLQIAVRNPACILGVFRPLLTP
jgi:hypothetical protein